jgi:hypothetical protein
MSALISTNTASISSQRTIPRASAVSNGRLHDHSADERSQEPKREQETEPVAVVPKNAEVQSFGQSSGSFEDVFVTNVDEGQCCTLRTGSRDKTPYSPEKPRSAKIDLLA